MDSVIADASIYNPGGTHSSAFSRIILDAYHHCDDEIHITWSLW
jgi:hypothetical protein